MKRVYYSLVTIASLVLIASCNSVSYERTKSGLLYKIISSSKDSVVKEGQWLKLLYTTKLNDDSVLQSNYGEMPAYVPVTKETNPYNPGEVFPLLRRGDSVITILMVDSLLKKGMMPEIPPFMKKGDRIITTFKVVDVFKNDSSYQADAQREEVRDRPRQMKEQEEQMAKRKKMIEEQKAKEDAEMEKSGEAARGIKAMEDYLAKKNISAEKTGKGTFVLVKEQGTGPAAALGKYVNVKYTGRVLRTDSTFESNVYPLHLGVDPVISGWTEGLQLFKEGGKGTLYIPGFRAYGANARPGSGFQPYEALIFDVEILKVSDTPIAEAPQVAPQRN
jgi:FKBP-type peptidyl-prolyl cis-trans isomerase FkpA